MPKIFDQRAKALNGPFRFAMNWKTGLVVFLLSVFSPMAVSQESDGPDVTAPNPVADAVEGVPPLNELISGRACLPAMTNVQARNTRSLNGTWQYLLDALAEVNRRPEKTRTAIFEDVKDSDIEPNVLKEYDWERAPVIEVPGSWNAQIPTLTWYDQLMWMKRHFEIVPTPASRQFVYFEGVNYHTIVFINGQRIGEHFGGFTPFCFEVTDYLVDGENTLIVSVNAEQDESTIPPKRADWNNYGGITRPVHLVEVPATFVANYSLALQQDGSIAFKATLDGERKGQAVRLRIPALGIDERLRAGRGDDHVEAFIRPEGPLRLWSPDSPYLYEVEVESGGEVIRDRIGLRTITVDGTRMLLNGEPLFLRGVSVHEEPFGLVPDRYMTKAGAEALLREVRDGLNGNFVRLAHYPHSETMLRAADELGVLVWSEIPVYWDVDFANPDVLSLARAMQGETVYRDVNRASIIIWAVANETLLSDARNAFLTQLAEDARELDNTRLVTMASHTVRPREGGVVFDDPVVGALDLISVNYYRGWYSNGPLDELPTIDWSNNATKPIILSEFGAGALAGFESDVNQKFSENFQAEYFAATLKMAENIPNLQGVVPWLLKDFRSPRRFHPEYQAGWNRKGLVSPSGDRKMAFDVVADWYAGFPNGPE